jgi:predicted anti-sigma-YlaC factor YlaD
MSDCERIHPLLHRVAEGEATPEEAMRVARHLPDCTTCRIIQAREIRLADMLEAGLEDLPVGEDFVRGVMARLPAGPPPRRSPGRRRGLKLAILSALLLGSVLFSAQSVSPVAVEYATATLPVTNLENAPTAVDGQFGLVRLFLVALEKIPALRAVEWFAPDTELHLLVAATSAALAGLAAAAALTALLIAAGLARQPN